MKKILLLLPIILLTSILVCNAFPDKNVKWGMEISSNLDFNPMPNTIEKSAYAYADSITSGVTAVRVRLACEKSITDYNKNNTNTPINHIKVEIRHYDVNYHESSFSKIFEYIEFIIEPNDSPKNYNYVFILNEKDFIESNIKYVFDNNMDYEISLCKLTIFNPSMVGDSIDISGLTIREMENQIIDDLNGYMIQISNSIKDLVNMIYEVILIFYWMIKIFITITAISMILWIFIWFYKLIKLVFGGNS